MAAVDLLTEMVGIESLSGGERRLASFLVDRLRPLGFVAGLDAAGNLIASWGDAAEELALVGHLDTAPGRIEFRRDAVTLRGRGAVDAKGPLAAAIAAVSRQPRDGRCRYTVIGAVEEESTSRGAHHLAASRSAPAGLIILEPSGWQGITIGYKGTVRVRWSHTQAASHGAGPLASAGDHAFEFVRRLQDHARAWSGDAGIFDRLDVRVLDCAAGSDGVVDAARIDVGMRVPPRYELDALLEAVRELGRDGGVDIQNVDPPVRTDRSSRLARRFVNAIRDAGGAPRFKLKTGTSDLNVLVPVWRCPAVAYGPGDSRLDHTPGEHLEIAELERAVDVLERVLQTR